MKVALLVLLAILLTACALRAAEVRGEAFIVTESQQAVRLPLIEIDIYDEAQILKHVATRKSQAERVIAHFDPIDKLAEANAKNAEAAYEASSKVRLEKPVGPNADYTAHFTAITSQFRQCEALDKQRSATRAQAEQAHGYALYPRTAPWYFAKLPAARSVITTDATGRFRADLPDGRYIFAARAQRRTGGALEEFHWLIRVEVHGPTRVSLDNRNLADAETPAAESVIQPIPDFSFFARNAMDGKDPEWLIAFVEKQEKEEAEMRSIAVQAFPAIGVPGSPLNREFIRRHAAYRTSRPEYFQNNQWPVKLAEESAAALGIVTRK